MRVTYTRRLGQHGKGTTHDLTDIEAAWLIDHGHARAADSAAHAPNTDTASDDTPDPDTATLAELRDRAGARGLPTYGTKAQLAARIADHQDT